MARKIKTYYDAIAAEPDAATVRRLAESLPQVVLEDGIRNISEQLRGPMSDGERAMLVMERKEFRAALALIEAAKES